MYAMFQQFIPRFGIKIERERERERVNRSAAL